MVTIETNYPGGNVVLEQVDGNTFYVHPDLRDTNIWWFYWNFRVRGAAGKTLTFVFPKPDVSPFGPAVSNDGHHWLHDMTIPHTDTSFAYTFDTDETYFAFALPYQLADFHAAIQNNPALTGIELGKSNKGRTVYAYTAGHGKIHVALSCRHHACESVASYVLEGILNELPRRPGILDRFTFYVLPFADPDGVENGDQGKGRVPHDHNRDYTDAPIYNTVRLWSAFLADKQLDAGLDIHDPYLFGDFNDHLSFIYPKEPQSAEPLAKFAKLTEQVTANSYVKHDTQMDTPFGTRWNKNASGSTAKDLYHRCGAELYCTIEVPYFGTVLPRADGFRALGADLLTALELYYTKSNASCV